MGRYLDGDAFRSFAEPSLVVKHQLFDTNDPAVANSNFAKEFVPHDIEVTRSSKSFHSIAHKALMAGVALYHVHYKSDVLINAGPLEDHYLLHIPISGRVQVLCEGQMTEIRPGQIGIVNPFTNYSLHRLDDCSQLTLRIERSALEEHLLELFGHLSMGPISFRSDIAFDFNECGNLIRLIELIHADAFEEDGGLNDGFCGIPTENLLARLLLRQIPNNYAEAAIKSKSNIAPYHVKRAEDFISRRVQSPITLAEIVEASGVSARTLFEGFRNFRGVSPMRQLKNVRLDRVRAELLGMRSGEAERLSLTRVAGDWGFEHMGNFSKDYKRRFGESPSQTKRGAGIKRIAASSPQ